MREQVASTKELRLTAQTLFISSALQRVVARISVPSYGDGLSPISDICQKTTSIKRFFLELDTGVSWRAATGSSSWSTSAPECPCRKWRWIDGQSKATHCNCGRPWSWAAQTKWPDQVKQKWRNDSNRYRQRRRQAHEGWGTSSWYEEPAWCGQGLQSPPGLPKQVMTTAEYKDAVARPDHSETAQISGEG